MNLRDSLRIHSGSRLALVGSGGKTTLLFNLAREIRAPVVLSTTTHLSVDELGLADRHWVVENKRDIERAFSQLTDEILLLTGAVNEQGNRVRGLSDDQLLVVKQHCDALDLPFLIEADGSRRLPLKAPGEHEPAIPGWVNQVVVLVGLSAIGQPLDDKIVFRSEQFAVLCAAKYGIPITLEILTDYLLHAHGGLKNIPPNALRSVFFNQLDAQSISTESLQVCSSRLLKRYDQVVWGSAAASNEQERVIVRDEPIAGIILAAGASSRFGRPKPLLEWHEQPFIRHVVLRCMHTGLQPVVVVVGEEYTKIRAVIEDLGALIIPNLDWCNGLSQSIKAGLAALPRRVGGALFLMSDVPQLPAALIETLLMKKRQDTALILAPRTAEGYANPVLFDYSCFGDLMSLSGDRGGKALFQRYTVKDIPWANAQDLRDIDTPADYDWLLKWR